MILILLRKATMERKMFIVDKKNQMLVPFCCVWYHHYSVSGKSSGEWSISKKLVSVFQVQCSLLHLLSSL